MYDFAEYYEAESLNQAKQLLSIHPKAKIIAGGTDILVKLRKKSAPDMELIGINKIEKLKQIEFDEKSGNLKIGALAVFNLIEKNDLIKKYAFILSQAAASIGGPQLRNIATIGGNICNGAVSADSAPSLFAMNAKLKLESLYTKNIENERIVDIDKFYLGPGKTVLKQNEILTQIIISSKDCEGFTGNYIKFSIRNAMDIATLGCAAIYRADSKNKIKDLRIALGVAGPTPFRCRKAEHFGKRKEFIGENIAKIAQIALEEAKPRDSWRASEEYRKQLIKVLVQRALVDKL